MKNTEVAVNKNGIEIIGSNLNRAKMVDYELKLPPEKECDIWVSIYNDPDDGFIDVSNELPKGSIKKLIGKELTWEDEPVKLC